MAPGTRDHKGRDAAVRRRRICANTTYCLGIKGAAGTKLGRRAAQIMFERFNGRARRVVELAQEAARALNGDYIGTEHLLLG
jgi:hypothetical protein